ncbi:MAG TPA: hypothetical protein VL633_11050 [Bacteroidota bacterium]|jgi:hypothetical protein|nr:hypothetical protein [Bacteroidota bacterium]
MINKASTGHILLTTFVLLLVTSAAATTGARGTRKPAASYELHVNAGWNLLSLPLDVADGRKGVLYPTAISPAYTYGDSYAAQETLQAGPGYWLKFNSPQTITIAGDSIPDMTMHLHPGWNLVGSCSIPIATNSLFSYPEGIVTPKYFGYDATAGGYYETDTIQPGSGYWVKSSEAGVLIHAVPNTTPPLISDSLRTVILDSINAFANRLPHADDSLDNIALMNYLRTFPEFEVVDTTPGSVWARFTDGRLFIRTDNFGIGDTVLENKSVEPTPMSEGQPPRTPADNLPFYPDAWIANAMGSYYDGWPGGGATQTVGQLQAWHKTTGYALATNAGADVWDLKLVRHVGVFYISAHGGSSDDERIPFCLWTATPRTPYFDMLFKDDLDSGYLAYFTGSNADDGSGNPIEETHYAITPLFVQRYMKFDPGALVFINACESYKRAAFANACISKGAGVYAGWTNRINIEPAIRSARHFFDRMLGTNQYFPENPPQRPFDADLVWNDMILKHYDLIPSGRGVAKFWLTPVIPNYNLLAPSILQAYPDPVPGSDDFYIDGLFGDNQGLANINVTVGGNPLGIREWVNSTKLRLDPPTHGGDVQVTVRGRTSNITQYTEWHAVFDYTLNGRGSLKQHIVMNVDFLADVHDFRINIADAPIFPFPRYIQVLNTSHADYECSGIYVNPKDTSIIEEYWTGSGSVPLGANFMFGSLVGPPNNANFGQLGFQSTYYVNGSPTDLGLPSDVSNMLLTMSTAYTIGGGYLPGSNSIGSYSLSWSDVVPTHKPSPNSAR